MLASCSQPNRRFTDHSWSLSLYCSRLCANTRGEKFHATRAETRLVTTSPAGRSMSLRLQLKSRFSVSP